MKFAYNISCNANLEYKPTNLLGINFVDRIERNSSTHNMAVVFHIENRKLQNKNENNAKRRLKYTRK